MLANHARLVFTWLRNLGQRVPRDVGLLELENNPKLGCAGVYDDPAKIGALAMEMLFFFCPSRPGQAKDAA